MVADRSGEMVTTLLPRFGSAVFRESGATLPGDSSGWSLGLHVLDEIRARCNFRPRPDCRTSSLGPYFRLEPSECFFLEPTAGSKGFR